MLLEREFTALCDYATFDDALYLGLITFCSSPETILQLHAYEVHCDV
jgi:hypothetical protein